MQYKAGDEKKVFSRSGFFWIYIDEIRSEFEIVVENLLKAVNRSSSLWFNEVTFSIW